MTVNHAEVYKGILFPSGYMLSQNNVYLTCLLAVVLYKLLHDMVCNRKIHLQLIFVT